ncbi:hypothetical protein [Pseudomonas sp.]|jgi:hypothetical protein|uniref:hypothetical protein n=1 Tax=Pseudomonas sp. TaxID=306 RepID=UPI002EDAEE92
MSQYRLGKLYIRRLKRTDSANDWRTGINLHHTRAVIEIGRRGKAYVMVRHGFPLVMAIANSRRELETRMWFGRGGSFKQYAGTWKLSPEERAQRAIKALP